MGSINLTQKINCRGSLSQDNAKFGHFTSLYRRGRQRIVSRLITNVHSHWWQIIYLNCGGRYEFMIDYRSYTQNLAVVSWSLKKNSGLNGIRTQDLCDTGAVLYQLSYQAIWQLVILWVRNIPVEVEGCEWIYDSSYIWTAEKDMNLWLIIAATHTTWAVVKLKVKGIESRSGMNFFQALNCVCSCDDQSWIHVHNHCSAHGTVYRAM